MGKCFLILGVPRSGTSATAGVLHYLGVDMGVIDLVGNEWNLGGDFQDRFLEEPLITAFEGIYLPRKPDPTHLYAQRCFCRAKARQYGGADWGFKSTRISAFLPEFAAAVGHENISVIQTSRSDAESKASWKARTGCSDAEAAAVIDATRERLADGLLRAGLVASLTVNFDELLNSPNETVTAIAAFIGRPVTAEATQWINADWRRFTDG